MDAQDAYHISSYFLVNFAITKKEKAEKQTNKTEAELYTKKIKCPSCWKWLIEIWENGTAHIQYE